MEIKELIDSGSLELYVMGALPADETQQIDRMRAIKPELEAEILRIEETLQQIATASAIKPREELKEKIARKINFEVELDLSAERIGSVTIQMPGIIKYALAAAVAGFLLVSGLSIYLYRHNKEAERQIAALLAEKNELANAANDATNQMVSYKTQAAILADVSTHKVILKGLEINPAAWAVVYWNDSSGQTFINSSSMPATDSTRQFQLWAIVDGKATDLGVIEKNSSISQMKPVKKAQAFTISLEPLGGSAVATTLYMLGKI